MLKNRKGAALLQVLLVTAILGGMVAMLLRASLSRTTSGRRTRKEVSYELLIEACRAEVNMMWSRKTPWAFERDMAGCWMNCKETPETDTGWDGKNYTTSQCNKGGYPTRYYDCQVPVGDKTVLVRASFVTSGYDSENHLIPSKKNGYCVLQFYIDSSHIEQL